MAESRTGERLLLGFLSGFSATLPMTCAMARLHRLLPARERYPLPPREISESLPRLGASPAAATLLYHFLYGGAAGVVLAGMSRRRDGITGSTFGVAVWAASYLGWIAAARILRFGAAHPVRRTGLMLVAHVVWGTTLAIGLKELERAWQNSFSLSNSPRPHLKDRVEEG